MKNPLHESYYGHDRREIRPLVEGRGLSALDVGCGVGATLYGLKAEGICKWTAGIEIDEEVARLAGEHLDKVIVGSAEKVDIDLQKESLDLILCLDSLEHMLDPWLVISKLHNYLRPGGTLIASIPNVRNYNVIFPLLFHGEWNYQDEGILDRTHLRFFTRKSAIDLITCTGLKLDKIMTTMRPEASRKRRKWKRFIGKKFDDLFVEQYLIRAIKK